LTRPLLRPPLIALVNNAMIIASVNAFWQPIFIGTILLGAVVLDVSLLRISNAVGRKDESAASQPEAARAA